MTARDAAIKWHPLVLLVALAVLVKIPTLGTPAYWDEMAFLSQASWLADQELWRVVPGFRPDAQFFGHPPGLHLGAAVLFRMFSRSIETAHVVIACFGAMGVVATYALVRAFNDAKTAWLAALLLLFSPAWFANAGVFLADLPVAALGALCAVFAVRGRLVPFLVAASSMVLIKETAVAVVVALVAFRLFTRLPLTRATLRDAIPWAAPLLVIGAFIIVQKVATGKFFFIFDFEFEPFFDLGLRSSVLQAARISHWIFVAQFRWVLTGAIVLNLVTSPEARRRRELLLFALVALASGYAFSVIFYLPRYVLPVLPFYYTLGAVSLMALASTPLRQTVTGAAVLGLTLFSLARDPYRGHGEDNLQYLRVVRMHREVARDMAARYATARILSEWPLAHQLTDPMLGYVSAPLRVKWFGAEGDLADADVVVVARSAHDAPAKLETLLLSSGWIEVSTWHHEKTAVRLYQKPPDSSP